MNEQTDKIHFWPPYEFKIGSFELQIIWESNLYCYIFEQMALVCKCCAWQTDRQTNRWTLSLLKALVGQLNKISHSMNLKLLVQLLSSTLRSW